MSSPSGFLDCFLKFIKGEEGEKLPPPLRGGGRLPSGEIKKPGKKSTPKVNNCRVKEKKKSADAIEKKQTEGNEDAEGANNVKKGEDIAKEVTNDVEKKGEAKKEKKEAERKGEKGGVTRKSKKEVHVEIPVTRKRGRPPKKKDAPIVEEDVETKEIYEKPEKDKRLRLEEDLKGGGDQTTKENNAAEGGVIDEETVSESEVLAEGVVEDGKKNCVVSQEVIERRSSEVNVETEPLVGGEAKQEEMEVEAESLIEEEGGAETGNAVKADNESLEETKDEAKSLIQEEDGAEKESVAKADSESAAEVKVEAEREQDSVISNGVTVNCVNKDDEKVSGDEHFVHRKKTKEKKKKRVKREGETPRRRLSARKAKQKPNISYAESESEEDLPGLNENSDSDNDPMWVPNEKKASSDEDSGFSWSKYEKLHLKSKWPSGNCNLPTSPNPMKDDRKEHKNEINTETKDLKGNPVSDSGGASAKINSCGRRSSYTSTPCSTVARGSDVSKSAQSAPNFKASYRPVGVVSPEDRSSLLAASIAIMPFQSGSFIALKKDLEELEEPAIWRVDGKSLLQKYEPFRSDNGSIMYRNVSTYSGWGPKSHSEYQQVPVKFIQQTKIETIVKIIQEELVIDEEKLVEKLAKDYEKHMYSYEVYLQTLISQALDTNFIPEIIAEKDDYFLSSMNELDQVCEERKTKLLKSCQWTKKLMESLVTWPTMVVSPPEEALSRERCEVCSNVTEAIHVKMDGEPYKNTTLEYFPPSDISFKCKDFYVCKKCSDCVMLFHKIAHLKYHTYTEGLRTVAEKKSLFPCKDNTGILHDILADGPALQKKFHEISLMWARADIKSRRLKTSEDKLGITHN